MSRRMHRCGRFLLVASILIHSTARAQEPLPPTPEEIQAAESALLFSSHDILELTVEADFSTMMRKDRVEEPEERPGILRWANPDGSIENEEIQVRTRGEFRLARRNCDFPPIRLNVKKESTKGTLFEGQDKLKVVAPCKKKQDYWEQYVLSEYTVYRMFNVLSPLSFRPRLARITFVDSGSDDEPFTKYAFLLEDDSDMAARNGGRKQEWVSGQLDPARLEPHHAILVDVFQYMIGNTDWSGVQMHNMELFRGPGGQLSTVPFDFDFAGIVDARYANPDEILPIRSVRDRLFRGLCPDEVGRAPADYEAVYQLFRDNKEEIYEVWRNQEGLEEDRKKDTLEYLDDFYEVMDDPGKIRSRMLSTCRSYGSR